MLKSKSNVGTADKEHALKERIKSTAPTSIPLLIFLYCVCHYVACSCLCFCHAVTLSQHTNNGQYMSALHIINIKNIALGRCLAKEMLAKHDDHLALYNIISRCNLKESEEASAI
jgi:hypothetical protein